MAVDWGTVCMTAEWQLHQPERPDRYFDWELLSTRVARAGGTLEERWCSVLVQVHPGPVGQLHANLVRLRDEISTQPIGGTFTIKMNAEELTLLDEKIAELADESRRPVEPDDVGLQFFLYLPEVRAYANGAYAVQPHYRIRLVGPPIVGLRFNTQSVRSPVLAAFMMESAGQSKKVAIGIIDDGIGFAHERFRTRNAQTGVETTRIERIWLQDLERSTETPDRAVAFGRRLRGSEIDASLAKAALGAIRDTDVYRDLGLLDFRREGQKSMARRATHGTHVMDLACGFDRDDPAGKLRPIYAVQLPDAATADSSGVTMASYVLQGLRQIMLWADQQTYGAPLPLVVNFSYGFYAGPKDGTHYLELEIDRLVAHRNKTTPTAVVLPAGNGYRRRTTARHMLQPGQTIEIDWMILPDDASESFLEIWFDDNDARLSNGESSLSVVVAPPAGPMGPVAMPADRTASILSTSGKPFFGVYVDTGRPGHRARVFLAASPTKSVDERRAIAPAGLWKLSLSNRSAVALDLDMTIQRDDTPVGFRQKGRQSYFEHPAARERAPETGNHDALGSPQRPCPITHLATLSAIGNGRSTVLVGAAEDGAPIVPSDYTSSGPTKARAGPDFSAIADDGVALPGVLAAGTLSGTVVAMRGSSVAAPQVARALADVAASVDQLKQAHGAASEIDPRLGTCVIKGGRRQDLPARGRSRI